MSTLQPLPVYLINIARATERLQQVCSRGRELGIAIELVEGVDGLLVPEAQWVDVDQKRFGNRHGRRILPGEYGCYRSHLLALRQFIASGNEAAVIIEDDIALDGEFMARALAASRAVPDADMIKLVNHRWKGFRFHARSECGDTIGRCLFGPQGSTACYLVTRRGAEKIARSLAVMSLPWDVAIERGWDMDISVFSSKSNLVGFNKSQRETMIGRRRDYRAAKLAAWRRLPAHLFRTVDFFRRLAYVLGPRSSAQTSWYQPAAVPTQADS
ncbi:glycosyltransferase family 25 protein [Rhizobium tumorigenes]|uniref:glycosyltransferase family 25 protein n=1 Tax=Rhizobium tumorigenes TaxID=2041385 RepID=UPI00241D6A36|nr:glycosyltransferase family 25 protein [Rhizobium tumorigenes]WFS00181.1 glycosyltransferase family 25 protein [Rhizobium tumorigenes]